ncbi:helix-turn-helix domain-containing protein [Gulosibacter sp. ACHW.36C]|uniref:Dynein regulation protein LC7 n=1 Tax=Gulosibacter sediminis TaxID=1729695 RepID=A0ABY4MXA4_9MICO|nr:helix-turn-helix domain-containing protein [Gulosibacter sediminis]UQN15051.1 dynein regulation protein LC7 [Gulosibacter sediminis]
MTASNVFTAHRGLSARGHDDHLVRFLNSPNTKPEGIRPVVARSWYRSRAAGVDAFNEHAVMMSGRVDEYTLLAASDPLRQLDEFAADLGGYVDLTAPNGALLRPDFLRSTDQFPEGYSLLEESCGSTAEGLALEEGRGVWLAPEEHFRADMRNNWCFATLIRDPFHNRVRGVIGLTFPQTNVPEIDPASTLLMLQGVASRIEQEIASRTSVKEQILLREYLKVSRRRRDVAVVAMDGKNSLMNNTALDLLEDHDLATVSGYAKATMASGRSAQPYAELDGIGAVQLDVTAVPLPGGTFGAIVVTRPVKPRKSVALGAAEVMHTTPTCDKTSEALKLMLDGVGPEFDRMLSLATTVVTERRAAAIVGETGTGKRRLANAIARLTGSTIEIDARRGAPGLPNFRERFLNATQQRPDVLLITNADELTQLEVHVVCRELSGLGAPVLHLTAVRHTDATQRIAETVSSLEISTVPLRNRREDITVIASAIAREVGDKVLSKHVLAELTNADWPRNIDQLRSIVLNTVAQARGAEATRDDLPQGFQTVRSTGRLSRLEEAELAELRAALRESNGNRRLAAETLQIGRSTLYRRMDFFRSRGLDI